MMLDQPESDGADAGFLLREGLAGPGVHQQVCGGQSGSPSRDQS